MNPGEHIGFEVVALAEIVSTESNVYRREYAFSILSVYLE